MVRLRAAGADGKMDDGGCGLQAIPDHLDGAIEVGADAIHLVDEAHPRHLVLVRLAPHRLGLRLDAGDGVEHRDRAVEHAQRPLDLDGEVDVTRGVDDVDAVVVPDAGRRRRRDRDAALLLLRHVVHGRRAVVDLADLVALPGVVEDALGRGGLSRVDMGHDADVAGALEWKIALSHLSTSLSGCCSLVAPAPGDATADPAIGTMFNDIGVPLGFRGPQTSLRLSTMRLEEYRSYDGLGLAQLVRAQQVTAGELLDLALQRTADTDQQIAAVVYAQVDRARRAIVDWAA